MRGGQAEVVDRDSRCDMAEIRAGAAITPTVSSQGADGSATDPRVFQFETAYARPCIVRNATGNGRAIHVKLNVESDEDFGGSRDDGGGYFPINDGWAVEVSMRGQLCIERVSVITLDAADDLDDVLVRGWTP